MSGEVPSAASSVLTLARITLKRLTRGKALFICLVLALLPVLLAAIMRGFSRHSGPDALFTIEDMLLALLPPVFVGASVGEEIEEKTSAYLWSRPIPRWAVLAGKLVALAPIAALLMVGSWIVAVKIGISALPSLRSCIALGGGAIAISFVAAGMSTLIPKYGVALAIIYLIVDGVIGALPFSLAELSLTHQVRVISDLYSIAPSLVEPMIALVGVAGVWGTLGFLRIRRVEV